MRVGITSDPMARKKYWESQHPRLRNWRIVATNLTYHQAQDLEDKYVARGYQGSHGGDKKSGYAYSVYIFEY